MFIIYKGAIYTIYHSYVTNNQRVSTVNGGYKPLTLPKIRIFHSKLLNHQRVTRGSPEGHQRVTRGSPEGHQRVTRGSPEGHQRVTSVFSVIHIGAGLLLCEERRSGWAVDHPPVWSNMASWEWSAHRLCLGFFVGIPYIRGMDNWKNQR